MNISRMAVADMRDVVNAVKIDLPILLHHVNSRGILEFEGVGVVADRHHGVEMLQPFGEHGPELRVGLFQEVEPFDPGLVLFLPNLLVIRRLC